MAISLVSFVLALQLAGGQSVQRVFKCTDAGVVAYQSTPCQGAPAASWEVAAMAHDPAVDRNLEQLRVELRDQWNASMRTSKTAGNRQGSTTRPAAADACQRARAGRDAAFRKAGLRRSFALSSRWDNAVHDACR